MQSATDRRIFVTSPELFESALELLRTAGEVRVWDGPTPIPRADLEREALGADALVTMLFDRVDEALLALAPRLRIVANVAVGYDNVDAAAAARRGVWVTNTPDVLTEATADLAWALILATARRLGEAERLLRSGAFLGFGFRMLLGMGLGGKVLLVVGPGRIGQAVARRATGFGMVVATAGRGTPATELDLLLASADVVSLHVPLTEETRHLVDARRLGLMKRSAILVNTARGPVVDEEALAEALHAGCIAGAGLDVYEREPEVHTRLLDAPGAVLLPHIGSATVEARQAMAEAAASNVVEALAGRRPPNVV